MNTVNVRTSVGSIHGKQIMSAIANTIMREHLVDQLFHSQEGPLEQKCSSGLLPFPAIGWILGGCRYRNGLFRRVSIPAACFCLFPFTFGRITSIIENTDAVRQNQKGGFHR